MKTRILGMLLCLLCLPGCGDKAQKSHKTAGSVQQEQADTMTLGNVRLSERNQEGMARQPARQHGVCDSDEYRRRRS